MEAHIEAKNLYGAWKFYPINETATLLAAIAGTKTLTPESITLAQRMGVKFIQHLPRKMGDVSLPFNLEDYV